MDVSPDWDQFASQNGGNGTLQRHVLGRPVWDYVAGLETRSYLNALFFWCRQTGKTVSLPYRCDSGHERRDCRMGIQPLDGYELQVTHHILKRKPQNRPYRMDATLFNEQCSQCLRCRHGDDWLEPLLPVPPRDFPIRYLICRDCRNNAREMLRGDVVAFRQN